MDESNLGSVILKAAEYTVGIAKKNLGLDMDYSTQSIRDLDAVIEFVKNHFSNQRREGKLTDETVSRAAISLGGYLGEVLRRKYGGTWILENDSRNLVINGISLTPIRYIHQNLEGLLSGNAQKYITDIEQTLNPKPALSVEKPLQSTAPPPHKPAVKPANKKNDSLFYMGGGILILIGLCFVVFQGIQTLSIATRKPPVTATLPYPTNPPPTPTPKRFSGTPNDFLQMLPNGFYFDESLGQQYKTLEDGTKLNLMGFRNNYALTYGDLYLVMFSLSEFPDSPKARVGYELWLDAFADEEKGTRGDIEIDGTDSSSVYFVPVDDVGDGEYALQGAFISRVDNVLITTIGFATYNPEGDTMSFLERFAADIQIIHLQVLEKLAE